MKLHRILLGGRRIEARTLHGIVLRLDPKDYIDGFVLREGFYESEVLDAVCASLSPGDVFWDVGANLGLHALTVKQLCPAVSTHAFEPSPKFAPLIGDACRRNRLDVDVHQLALSAVGGRAKFFIHEGNSGRSGLHNWDSNPKLKHIEVMTCRGDRIVAERLSPAPTVMKIDVEGSESEVLEGMGDLLKSSALHTIVFEDSVEDASSAKALLSDAGFQISRLSRLEKTQHTLDNFLARKYPNPPSHPARSARG